MDYLKLDPDIDTDPALEKAGWWATRVYELLLKVSAKKDLRGRLPEEFQDPAWLARRWNLTAAAVPGIDPEAVIKGGLAALAKVGKVIRDGGDLVISGWEKFYKPAMTQAERAQAYRDRKKSPEPDEASRPVTPPSRENERHDTHPPTIPTHPQTDVTGAGELLVRLANTFREVHGTEFRGSAFDLSSIEVLRKHSSDEEIDRRWRSSLTAKYRKCASLKELAQWWDHFANGPPVPKRVGKLVPVDTKARGSA